MPQPRQETPPLAKAFFLEYDHGDTNYPIVGIARDPKEGLGMTPPQLGTYCRDTRYSSHIFTELRVTHPDQRHIEVYRLLPGPWETSESLDPRKNIDIVEKRRLNLASNISPTNTINYNEHGNPASITQTIKRAYEGSDILAWEIQKNTLVPQYNSSASALKEYTSRAYQWPILFNANYENTHRLAGANWFEKKVLLQDVELRTYWVIANTAPQPNIETIITGSICTGDNNNVTNVLHDAYTTNILIATGSHVAISYNATTPSFSEFFGISSAQLAGSVSATEGSNALTGVGTSFTSLTVGSIYYVGNPWDGIAFMVASITDDTNLIMTTSSSWSYSGAAYFSRSSSGTAWPGTMRCIDGNTICEIPNCLYRVEEQWAQVPDYSS